MSMHVVKSSRMTTANLYKTFLLFLYFVFNKKENAKYTRSKHITNVKSYIM